MAESPTLAGLSDAALAERAASLAAERTRVRLAQNEVTAEQDLRRALGEMSGPARDALLKQLGRSLPPSG